MPADEIDAHVRRLFSRSDFERCITRTLQENLGEADAPEAYRTGRRLVQIVDDIQNYMQISGQPRELYVVTLGSAGKREWETGVKYVFDERGLRYKEQNLDKAPRENRTHRRFRTNQGEIQLDDGAAVLIFDKSIKTGYTMAGAISFILDDCNPADVLSMVMADTVGMSNYPVLARFKEALGMEKGLARVAPDVSERLGDKTKLLSSYVFEPQLIRRTGFVLPVPGPTQPDQGIIADSPLNKPSTGGQDQTSALRKIAGALGLTDLKRRRGPLL